MKKSENDSSKDREIKKKCKALKRDWRKLSEADRFSRADEISKLSGWSNRRLAIAIGVNDKTIGTCLNKGRQKRNVATAVKPAVSTGAQPNNGSAKDAKVAVPAKAGPPSEDAEFTDTKLKLFRRFKKINLAALNPPKETVPPKSEPTTADPGVKDTVVSIANDRESQIKHVPQVPTTGLARLQEIYDGHDRQMEGVRRNNEWGARALGLALKK